MRILWLGLVMGSSVLAISLDSLKNILTADKSPFAYNVGIKIYPAKSHDAAVTICCHGYGHSNKIGDVVRSFGVIPDHLVSFNFPDYGITDANHDPKKSVFGSPAEILPLLYIVKKCVIDGKQESINLYGFSAGGGAIINMLGMLSHSAHDDALKTIGISASDKKVLLTAIEKGLIILDCPLKSMDEIMDARGSDPKFMQLCQRYIKNNMRPIDVLNSLSGLHLSIILHFQNPDDILGNRDDKLFIDRLSAANKGTTQVVIGNEGGHNSYHASLWKRYKEFKAHKGNK